MPHDRRLERRGAQAWRAIPSAPEGVPKLLRWEGPRDRPWERGGQVLLAERRLACHTCARTIKPGARFRFSWGAQRGPCCLRCWGG